MKKTMLAFDIDHTLGLSKLPIPAEVAELLSRALEHFNVTVISGRSYDQFLYQVVGQLPNPSTENFERLFLLPAQGSQFYRFNNGWQNVYRYDMSNEQIAKIFSVTKPVAQELGFWREENREAGDTILDNRQSQVTFAGLDTSASNEEKRAWDPDHSKREAMVARLYELAPEFEYKIGGNTSIDITCPGMDKGFGMQNLIRHLGIKKEEILYFGDMTQPGGNDYPVVELGIDTITVGEYTDTIFALKAILSMF